MSVTHSRGVSMTGYKAAIDVDAALQKPLGEISAAQFLQVLAHPKIGGSKFGILADKKKYELWVEEGEIFKVPVGEIIQRLRGEKKKVELEVPYLGRVGDPAPYDHASLAEEVATRILDRLGP